MVIPGCLDYKANVRVGSTHCLKSEGARKGGYLWGGLNQKGFVIRLGGYQMSNSGMGKQKLP